MIFSLQLKGDKSYHYFIFSLIVYKLHLSYMEKKLLNFTIHAYTHSRAYMSYTENIYVKKGHSI